jgi:gamma-butyrobetaine dioxygenase
LTAHTDDPYKQTDRLIQFCYFAENDATGGEFFLVDGFKVANDFRSAHPELFDLLTGTPVEFEQLYTTWRYLYRVRRPIIELDAAGNPETIHFGHSHCWTWQVPPEQSSEYYIAYHLFLKYLNDDQYHWEHQFTADECAAFRNSRVLHGRNSFDPRTGTRHLITTYLSWEQLEARIRFERDAPTYTLT